MRGENLKVETLIITTLVFIKVSLCCCKRKTFKKMKARGNVRDFYPWRLVGRFWMRYEWLGLGGNRTPLEIALFIIRSVRNEDPLSHVNFVHRGRDINSFSVLLLLWQIFSTCVAARLDGVFYFEDIFKDRL